MTFILVIDKIESGGAEKILLDFRKYLIDRGHVVKIFVLYSPTEDYAKGFNKNSSNIILKVFQQIIMYVKLLRYVKANQPDYIYSFLDRSNVLTALLPKKYTKCLSVHNVLSIQYSKLQKWIKKITMFTIRATYNRGNNIVLAVSDLVSKDLCDNFSIERDRLRVVTNCCDRKKIIELAKEKVVEYDFDGKYKYVINIGRITHQKAQWKLVKALKYIYDQDENANIKLIILGEGELKDNLQQLAEKLGVAEFVHILPFNNNPYKFMAKADLLVLPSIFEGFPIVISEAAALNRPFVGSKKAIPLEVFTNTKTWEDCTYSNIQKTPDFSSTIYEDDITLAKLIVRCVESNCAQYNIVNGYSIWNMQNDKDRQFDQYLELFGRQ